MSTVDPSEKLHELDPQVTRVLKRGDLTRINSTSKSGKLKDHYGDLARVVKAEAVGPTLENSHPFVYDLELVLGGKLHNVFRDDLLYTTATKEGMLDDSRSRRKRKPNALFDADPLTEEAKKAKAARKKKATAKKAKAVAATTKTTTTKKRPAGEKVKGGPVKKVKAAALDEIVATATTATTSSQAMDLFERHRREFERCLGRLEKMDAYDFFGTDVPPEFLETYRKPNIDVMQGPAVEDSANPAISALHAVPTSQSPPLDSSKPAKNTKKKMSSDDVDSIRFPSTPPFNFVVVRKRMELGRYILDRVRIENDERIAMMTPYWKSIGRKNITRRPKKSLIPILHPKGINWELFREDINGMCDSALERNRDLEDDDGTPGTLSHTCAKIKDLMEQLYEKNGRRHLSEMEAANHRHRFSIAMDKANNTEAAMQGKWKKDAFPERKYERLRGDKVCAGLSQLDERIAAYELKTSLDDKFIGLAYKYDDTGQSEGWMKSILDVAGNKSEHQQAAQALASDDGAIKAQVNACMQSLLIGVLDKVMTDSGVLGQKELRCANEMDDSPELGPEFVVQEVWGIDCYTRRNISICLETEFDADSAQIFTEKWLLPAINACPADLAHDISNACRVLEGMPFDHSASLTPKDPTTYDRWKSTLLGKALLNKVAGTGPAWLGAAARLVRIARDNLGPDFFRVHPKGHGSIVLGNRLEPNRLVTFYRGEVYPSWRWGEKTDAIAKIQEQKGLKPVLPDFFNMALERPQHDPRGYGLLFVDASRKSNYGSMLSHSCQPSCEVHVVAVNGELRLAITTIREMSIGDELTFDYNAVTESLMEFQSAVCLCGHKRCSGSFLHFAAADCYQQVLNRNSPVASRLANLVKGCTKKVMADDDEKILMRHGFQTAAFGAVSVNRRNANALDKLDSSLDSMNIVPVWLRTYVADTLRYIEYERRALPIALICNDLYDESGNVPIPESEESTSDENVSMEEEEEESDEDIEEAEEVSPKPEPTFFYYSRMERGYFESLLGDDGNNLSGTEMRREVQKLAAATWKSLDDSARETWKAKAFKEWEVKTNAAKAKNEELKKRKKKKVSKKKPRKAPKLRKKADIKTVPDQDVTKKPKISFQQADAEGVSAMEQRIQQLTQTLSRVGRVLDRHRETKLRLANGSDSSISDEQLRDAIHSPLVIMPDEHVVAWMWNHEEGIVRTLSRCIESENEVCVSPELRSTIRETLAKHDILEQFGKPWEGSNAGFCGQLDPSEGRERLNKAMLELRKNLLDGIQQMASVIKKHKAKARLAARKKDFNQLGQTKDTEGSRRDNDVKSVMEDILLMVEKRFGFHSNESVTLSSPLQEVEQDNSSVDPDEGLDPWLRNFNKRFKIEKAADLLLLYAKTGYFFSVKTYEPLKSSPIEVYARELGNAVPASTVDIELRREPNSALSSVANSPSQSPDREGGNESSKENLEEEIVSVTAKKSKDLCEPEDIISKVAVEYQGDYVLSQLLQWYNGGIGQKPGLPDILGCVLLPSMKGCWSVDGTTVSNSFTDRATRYQATTRRRLISWLKDPLQRGNPWPDEVRRAFLDKDDDGMIPDVTGKWLPLGSPILDFLVTGDDHNMNTTVAILSSFHSSAGRSGDANGEGLISTVDEGRPAEAVSNWVQCENPKCQKWRKVPWHVDIDMLPEQFYCKDNLWNPKSASCDAPEDVWDQTTDAQVGLEDTTTLLDALEKTKQQVKNSFKLGDFRLGAQFDVRRPGKKTWCVGTVVKVDLAGASKRVKVHLQNRKIQEDEWIDVESPRLAPLYSKVKRPQKKEKQKMPKKQKEIATKKHMSLKLPATLVQKVKKGTSDSAAISGAHQSHLMNTDDSSMADVFTEDSDSVGDIDEEPVATHSPESDGLEDGLDDSDVEDEDEIANAKHVPVTDDSSPDAVASREAISEPSTHASVWTIPKKKKSPAKTSILTASESSSLKTASVSRIPRKKLAEDGRASESLLQTLAMEQPAIVQEDKTRTSPSHKAPNITSPGDKQMLGPWSRPVNNNLSHRVSETLDVRTPKEESTHRETSFSPRKRGPAYYEKQSHHSRAESSALSPSGRREYGHVVAREDYGPRRGPRQSPREEDPYRPHLRGEMRPSVDRARRYDRDRPYDAKFGDERHMDTSGGVPRTEYDNDRSHNTRTSSRNEYGDSETGMPVDGRDYTHFRRSDYDDRYRPNDYNDRYCSNDYDDWYRSSDYDAPNGASSFRNGGRNEYDEEGRRQGGDHRKNVHGYFNQTSPNRHHDRHSSKYYEKEKETSPFDDNRYRSREYTHEYDRSRYEHEYDRSRYDRREREYDRNRHYDDRDNDRSPRHKYRSHMGRDRSQDGERSRKRRSHSKGHGSPDERDRSHRSSRAYHGYGQIADGSSGENMQPR